jgi:hypothetical protein
VYNTGLFEQSGHSDQSGQSGQENSSYGIQVFISMLREVMEDYTKLQQCNSNSKTIAIATPIYGDISDSATTSTTISDNIDKEEQSIRQNINAKLDQIENFVNLFEEQVKILIVDNKTEIVNILSNLSNETITKELKGNYEMLSLLQHSAGIEIINKNLFAIVLKFANVIDLFIQFYLDEFTKRNLNKIAIITDELIKDELNKEYLTLMKKLNQNDFSVESKEGSDEKLQFNDLYDECMRRFGTVVHHHKYIYFLTFSNKCVGDILKDAKNKILELNNSEMSSVIITIDKALQMYEYYKEKQLAQMKDFDYFINYDKINYNKIKF